VRSEEKGVTRREKSLFFFSLLTPNSSLLTSLFTIKKIGKEILWSPWVS
jgi:hypothetical protein